MADISKVKLPSGNEYNIKDATARELISQLQAGSFFLGITTTNLTDGATTNPIKIDNADVTATNGNIAIKGNKEFIFNGTKWIEFGDLSAVQLSKGSGANVLGASTTFAVTQPTITATKTTRYIAATASGAAVGADGTASALTGLGTPSTAEFITDVTTRKQKLQTVSIVPTNGTESVSSVSRTTSKLATTTIPNVTNAGSASSWSFTVGTGTNAETLVISGGNGTAPTLGTAITAATGAVNANGAGATIVTGVTITAKTVAKAGSATTVATGAIAADGAGAEVVYGVDCDGTASALTGLGTPTTATVLTGVKVTAQPTVKITADTTTGTNKAAVLTDVSATASGAAVSANSNNNVKVAKYDDITVTTNN